MSHLNSARRRLTTHRHQIAASCVALASAAVAAAVSACSTTAPERDPYCTEWALVPITVGERVYFERGRCKAWEFGPTKQQKREFEERKGPGLIERRF